MDRVVYRNRLEMRNISNNEEREHEAHGGVSRVSSWTLDVSLRPQAPSITTTYHHHHHRCHHVLYCCCWTEWAYTTACLQDYAQEVGREEKEQDESNE